MRVQGEVERPGKVYGPDVGAHARSSIGMALTLNAPVVCEAEVEIDPCATTGLAPSKQKEEMKLGCSPRCPR